MLFYRNATIDRIPNRFLEIFDNYKIEFYELLDGLNDIYYIEYNFIALLAKIIEL